jgi:hypothetical protein
MREDTIDLNSQQDRFLPKEFQGHGTDIPSLFFQRVPAEREEE